MHIDGNALIRTYILMIAITLLNIQTASAEKASVCKSRHEAAIAIFINPTDEEIESMKKENSIEDFYTIADDNLYYQYEAVEFLKKRGFPYCFTKNDKHEFVDMKNKKTYTMKKECSFWCLILWNGRSEPEWASAIDIFMYESYLKAAD